MSFDINEYQQFPTKVFECLTVLVNNRTLSGEARAFFAESVRTIGNYAEIRAAIEKSLVPRGGCLYDNLIPALSKRSGEIGKTDTPLLSPGLKEECRRLSKKLSPQDLRILLTASKALEEHRKACVEALDRQSSAFDSVDNASIKKLASFPAVTWMLRLAAFTAIYLQADKVVQDTGALQSYSTIQSITPLFVAFIGEKLVKPIIQHGVLEHLFPKILGVKEDNTHIIAARKHLTTLTNT